MANAPEQPESDVAALHQELARLNNSYAMSVWNSWPKLVLHNLLRGLAFGLGTALGASALVWFVVMFLSSIDFIPIIGEWATEIAQHIQLNR